MPAPAKPIARVDTPIAKPKARFEIVLAEVAVDRPLYPVPGNFRPRKDAVAIEVDVERSVEREVGRIAACVNEPKSAAIFVGFAINEKGRVAREVGASASLTSPGQDAVRDRCIADLIKDIVFYPPGRVVPIELALVVRTDD
jgi:hypothetical protein